VRKCGCRKQGIYRVELKVMIKDGQCKATEHLKN